MSKCTTAERLQQIMNERNLKQVDILQKSQPYCKKYGVNLGKTALSQYISGKFIPRQDKLTILGLALNVSEAWLMGYDVPMERTTPEQKDSPGVPENAGSSEIVRLFNSLSPDNQAKLLELAHLFLIGQSKNAENQ